MVRRGCGDDTTAVQLAHGCLSCALRGELLPVLRSLASEADVHRIVLHLHAAMEPETVCWALEHMVIDGDPGGRRGDGAGRSDRAGRGVLAC